MSAVMDKTGFSRATVYRRVADGSFPAPVDLGRSMSAWVEDEVDAWIEARISDRDSARGASAPSAHAHGAALPAH